MKRNQPVLIMHGGAGGPIEAHRSLIVRKKLKIILKKAYAKLLSQGALEAVTAAVTLLENDPLFNAGRGSMLQKDGRPRLSASIMDGAALNFSAVVNVEKVMNPILVARKLLQEEDKVLAGEGALKFAREYGFNLGNLKTLESVRRWNKHQASYDTVGACALDEDGKLASATSTGGRGFERPGRVSDSVMPIGNYATRFCAVSATGIGEEIMAEGVAVKIATRVEDGLRLAQAFQKTFLDLRKRGRRIGAIGVDCHGIWCRDTTTETLLGGVSNKDGVYLF